MAEIVYKFTKHNRLWINCANGTQSSMRSGFELRASVIFSETLSQQLFRFGRTVKLVEMEHGVRRTGLDFIISVQNTVGGKKEGLSELFCLHICPF